MMQDVHVKLKPGLP